MYKFLFWWRTDSRSSNESAHKKRRLTSVVDGLENVVGESERSDRIRRRYDDDELRPDEEEAVEAAERRHYVLVVATRFRDHAAEFGVGLRPEYRDHAAYDPDDQWETHRTNFLCHSLIYFISISKYFCHI